MKECQAGRCEDSLDHLIRNRLPASGAVCSLTDADV